MKLTDINILECAAIFSTQLWADVFLKHRSIHIDSRAQRIYGKKNPATDLLEYSFCYTLPADIRDALNFEVQDRRYQHINMIHSYLQLYPDLATVALEIYNKLELLTYYYCTDADLFKEQISAIESTGVNLRYVRGAELCNSFCYNQFDILTKDVGFSGSLYVCSSCRFLIRHQTIA